MASTGTPEHRHCCPTTRESRGDCIRDSECDRFITNMAPSARHLLQTRALLAMPEVMELPNKEATIIWDIYPEGGLINATDTIYTDGSMVDGPTTTIGRV